ncbi:MgtC/SapB family protein [candidate division KSB1 bacterium]
MFTEIHLEILIKVILAIILGGIIGLEREIKSKAAGLRTNILICLGSTVMMIVSIKVAEASSSPNADPARIAAQVVTGIGFLGAGTIIQSRGLVKGLTSAAVIWVIAGIGLVIGSGYYIFAAGVTLIAVIVLFLLGKIEKHLELKRKLRTFKVWTEDGMEMYDKICKMLDDVELISGINVVKSEDVWKISFRFYSAYSGCEDVQKNLLEMKSVKKVIKI